MLPLRRRLLGVLCLSLALAGCEPEPVLQTQVFRNARYPVELAPEDGLAAGDELYMRVMTRRPLYLYVVSEDAAGARRIIFPCSDWRVSRRLEAGRHRLPPPLFGRETFWQVPSVTPRERLLVIGSARPLPLLAATVTAAQSAEPCAAPVAAETSRWIDDLVSSDRRGLWISALDLKGIPDHG